VIIGTSTLNGGVATLTISNLTAGSHPLTAVYLGDANYATSTSNTVNEIVNIPTTTVLTTSANPITTTQPLTLTATVAPSGATGQVQFKDGSATIGTSTLVGGVATLTLPSLTTGIHPLTAVYLGNTTYNTSTSNTVNETVTAPISSIALSVSPNPASAGQTVTLSATVIPGATGSVQFFDGGTLLGQASLSAGAAALPVSTFAVGNHTLTAKYLGDTVYPPSTSNSVTLVVNKANTTTSLSTSGQPLILTATVSPAGATGQVQFFDGSSLLATVTLTNGFASFTITSTLSPGNHTLSATYLGDANFNPSTSSPVLQVVPPPLNQPTATFLSVSPNPANLGQSVTMSATVTPLAGTGPVTGTVTFTDNGGTIASVPLANGTAVFTTSGLAAGLHTIVAVYGGSANFSSSTSGSVTLW
jgi:hypothetical protein